MSFFKKVFGPTRNLQSFELKNISNFVVKKALFLARMVIYLEKKITSVKFLSRTLFIKDRIKHLKISSIDQTPLYNILDKTCSDLKIS